MRILATILIAAAILLLPVTLFAAFRPKSASHQTMIIYLPMTDLMDEPATVQHSNCL
jgi:hypothetical protein